MRYLAVLLLVGSSAIAQPDVPEIIRRSVVVNDSDFNALPRYSHRETDVELKVDGSGQSTPKSRKTIEYVMIDGSPYERLLMRDSQPLTPEEERKEEQKFRQEIQKRKMEGPSAREARVAKFRKSRESDQALMRQLAKAFTFTFVREEDVDGRPAYVLDAKPNPSFRPENQDGKLLTGMQGRIWIDKEGYHWVRVHAEVTKPVSYGLFIAKLGPGTKFEFELGPVEGELWLPKRFIQDVNAKVMGLKTIRTRQEETYTHYYRAGDFLAQR
jgi:hypothetical protein